MIDENFTFQTKCSISKNTSFNNVYNCYSYFALNSLIETVLEITLGVLSLISNISVIAMIVRKSKHIIVFERIIIAHSLVDIKVSCITLPIYHIFSIFNYWPFSKTFCIIWNTIDSSLNTISIFLVLFLAWTRAMSVLKPKNYLNNLLIRKSAKIILLLWITSYLIWSVINYFYISNGYQYGTCKLNYTPKYMEFITTLITWFLPLVLTVCLTVYVMRTLNLKKKSNLTKLKRSNIEPAENNTSEKNLTKPKTNSIKFHLGPESKLSIIIVIFLIEWSLSCLLWMIDSLCECIPEFILYVTYWLTFTASLTDPILVLVLNSKYKKWK